MQMKRSLASPKCDKLPAPRGPEQLGQRGDVAVHAEHRVADDQLDRRAAGRELPRQRGEVDMRVALDLRPREPRAVDQRGVVELVREDRRIGVAERGEQRDVGHVAAAEAERPGRRNVRREPGGELVLELRVRQTVAAHQVRGAAAGAVTPRAFDQGLDDDRVVGEAEVVVAAEGQQLARRPLGRGDALVRRAGGFGDAAVAAQRERIALTQSARQVIDQHGSGGR
jgi:hypothetical protein